MSVHVTTDFTSRPDEDGWYWARCGCGWSAGPFPDLETTADALMDHAFGEGWRDAKVHDGSDR